MQQPQYQYTNLPVHGTPVCYSVPTVQVIRAGPRIFDGYSDRQSRALGVTQIVIGLLCIAFNITAMSLAADDIAPVGHGIWSGMFFATAGTFGVAASRNKTTCPIVTFMVLSIISSVNCITLLTIGVLGACLARGKDYTCNEYGFNGMYYQSIYSCSNTENALIAMESCLAVAAVVEAVVAIWSSAICCRTVCCCARANTIGVVYSGFPASSNQFVGPPMMINNQQQYHLGQLYAPNPGLPVYGGYPYNNGIPQHQFSSAPPPYLPITGYSAPQYATHNDLPQKNLRSDTGRRNS